MTKNERLIVAGVLLLLALVLWLGLVAADAGCREMYARAKTAADSFAVSIARPLPNSLTCGAARP